MLDGGNKSADKQGSYLQDTGWIDGRECWWQWVSKDLGGS